jgi:hypothetical protein
MQKITPTLFQIISTDYLAQNFFVMIFGGWVIYGVDALFEGHTTFYLFVLSLILTPLGLLTFYWRYQTILSTFAFGQEITGRVVDIKTITTGKRSRDYIIEYEYSYQGQAYQYRNRVKNNDTARSLRSGQQITLIVNEKNPKTAFIKDMYLVYL